MSCVPMLLEWSHVLLLMSIDASCAEGVIITLRCSLLLSVYRGVNLCLRCNTQANTADQETGTPSLCAGSPPCNLAVQKPAATDHGVLRCRPLVASTV